MTRGKGIRSKILLTTTLTVITLAGVLMGIMIYFMRTLTNAILLETLQPMAKTAAGSVESNLHMLSDRLLLVSDDTTLSDPNASTVEKQAFLNGIMSGIEFVWLGLYTDRGGQYTGSVGSPSSITGSVLFDSLQRTENLVIDDISSRQGGLEIVIGTPVFLDNGGVQYLVGSYKYDVLNDVLSQINIGNHGSAFIIGADGRLLAHQDTSRVLAESSLTDLYGDVDDLSEITDRMVGGQTGSATVSAGGDPLFFCYAPVRGTHWSLAITAPRSDFMAASNQAVQLSLVITACLLVLAAVLTIRMAGRIQRPLGRVTNRIATLSQGDLHSPVEVEKTRDETEILSTALSDTVQGINQYTSELSRVLSELSQSNLDVSVNGDFSGDFIVMRDSLNQIVDFLNTIMTSLQHASHEVQQTSRLVSENATQVQESSGRQSDSLISLQEETQAIAESVQLVNRHTQHVSELIARAVEGLSSAESHMRDMLQAMENIGQNSEEITKINKFLEDISFQTNILSLNASIEAARAGAAGKGFAVVADEVRMLAAKSGDSSRRTNEIIANSQHAIEEGSAFAGRTAASLEEIMNITRDISQITHELSTAVDAQTSSLAAITGQIQQVNTLAEENASSSLDSAVASQTLIQQADTLQAMANRFRLREAKEVGMWLED